MFAASYSINIPGGDMAKRFGWNSGIGGLFTYKTRSNWLITAEADYLFGSLIKEDSILDHLRTSNGEIINKYGEYANIIISERGYYIGAGLGRLFNIVKTNPNSGIILRFSAGFMEHKIKIQNEANNAPQVLGNYLKGYDRLTNGLAINEFIGYMHIGKSQYFNIYVGFEFYQAWTRCRRDFNFDTMEHDTRNRNDLLYGFRFGWIIPIYERMPDKYYTF
jgi:hypothetical protein